jgi:hypothetical protein
LDGVSNARFEEPNMLQSLYTSAVVDQIMHDRLDAAARARRAPRKGLFRRGQRRAAPMTAPRARLHAGSASR